MLDLVGVGRAQRSIYSNENLLGIHDFETATRIGKMTAPGA
jgi:hypothetical protein